MADISVLNNGPLRVKGEVALKDAEGNSYDLGGRDAISPDTESGCLLPTRWHGRQATGERPAETARRAPPRGHSGTPIK